jgi:hypothetical protein
VLDCDWRDRAGWYLLPCSPVLGAEIKNPRNLALLNCMHMHETLSHDPMYGTKTPSTPHLTSPPRLTLDISHHAPAGVALSVMAYNASISDKIRKKSPEHIRQLRRGEVPVHLQRYDCAL